MTIDFDNCTALELWKYIAVHLKKNGIDTILVGGAVVSIYSSGIYQSGDLDFLLTDMFTKNLREILGQIGFVQQGGRHYQHPQCKHLFIEFTTGFLSIGEDNKIKPDEVEVEKIKIKILSPTDCVKDRLASYLYFKSRDCLDQALLVAERHPVGLEKIKKWSEGENHPEIFAEFKNLLK